MTTHLSLTGTAEANSTVIVYDGTKLLGTAHANSSGGWSYATGILWTPLTVSLQPPLMQPEMS